MEKLESRLYDIEAIDKHGMMHTGRVISGSEEGARNMYKKVYEKRKIVSVTELKPE
jgi:hypothetical protein